MGIHFAVVPQIDQVIVQGLFHRYSEMVQHLGSLSSAL